MKDINIPEFISRSILFKNKLYKYKKDIDRTLMINIFK